MDDGDFDDFDALIEDDANMDVGADDDEMDMMYAMEQENTAADKDKDGGAFDEPAVGTQAGPTQTQAGADDEDLDWLANAGATQTQGPNANGGDEDALFPDDDETDEAGNAAGKPKGKPEPYVAPERAPLPSNARDDAPALDAAAVDGVAVPVTTADGRRVFVRREPAPALMNAAVDPMTAALANASVPVGTKAPSLLSESIEHMLDKIEEARHAEALKESERLAERQRRVKDGLIADPVDNTDTGGSTNAAKKADKGLWVDKYSPKKFNELLSEDKVNREVLHWIKAWDGVVFKKAPPKPTQWDLKQQQFAAQRDGGRGGDDRGGRSGRGGRGGRGPAALTSHVPLDDDGRPVHKVLLLTGGPGIGKTTLAHVAAKLAGYRVVEVNASDDRGADALKTKVTNAVQMRAVMGDKRPNLVVIDEIDGALGGAEGRGAIQALLSIINGGKDKRKHGDENERPGAADDGASGKKPRGRKGPGPLMRPIICICNDLYAPALRPLREVAKIFRMVAPASARLNQRLREVCAKQTIRADTRAINALSEKAEGDVRACLNALQMIAQKGVDAVTLRDVNENVGDKDMTVQARNVWQALCSGHIANKRTRKQTRAEHTKHLYSQVASFGDNDLVLSGLFENINNLRLGDTSMVKSARALNSMVDADVFIGAGLKKGHFHLQPYVASAAMGVHACVSNAPAASNLEWPQLGKMHREAVKNKTMLRGWAASSKLLAGSSDMTLCETVPYLLTAISPEIRPVSANFLKPEEARLMRNSVSTMVSHALTYAAPPEGGIPFGAFRGAQVSMVLDPPVDRVVNFGSDVAGYVLPGTGAQRWQKGYKKDAQFEQGAGGEKTFGGVTRRVLPAAVKSMLQHEVRMEEIRRAECAVHGPGTPPAKREQKPQLKQGGVGGSEEHKEAAAKRLAMAMGGIGQKKESRNDRSKRLKQEEGGMPTVVYKYNEGFTNAVRKKVYMRDLF